MMVFVLPLRPKREWYNQANTDDYQDRCQRDGAEAAKRLMGEAMLAAGYDHRLNEGRALAHVD